MENSRNIWVDYLRSFLTILVVAHHSSLAYTTFATFDEKAYINSTNPIVDVQRWVGLDIFQNFNDIFFMSLMFLIGGLFLTKSMAKKGMKYFILDRAYRLFIPFLFLGTFFMLIAHFPAYYVSHNHTDINAFIKDFFTTERWPVGPPWFIWVLFLFNVVFAIIYPLINKLEVNITISYFKNHPIPLFFVLLCITWILYVPMAYNVGAGTWKGWLPFDFQLSRILLYFGYFMIGVLIGHTDFNHKIFSPNSAVVKMWWVWAAGSVAVYSLLTISSTPLGEMIKNSQLQEFNAWMIYYALYATSCVLSCLAFITTFRRFAVNKISWWSSLSDNAYLIYLTHYIFVIWAQFLLMHYEIPAFVKFVIVFVIAFVLSWLTSILMRKIKLAKRYL